LDPTVGLEGGWKGEDSEQRRDKKKKQQGQGTHTALVTVEILLLSQKAAHTCSAARMVLFQVPKAFSSCK
jgi:hypothetical protein